MKQISYAASMGGESLPTGTFHGGESLPTGTFHGGESLPTGTFHGGESLPTGTFHGSESLPTGTFHGGETLPTGTFHFLSSSDRGEKRSRSDSADESEGGGEPPSGSAAALRVSKEVLERIMRTLGSMPPEQGGALGADPKTGTVTNFYFDQSSRRTSGTYSPDSSAVTKIIRQWKAQGIRFCGMIHSHPGQFGSPSEGDRVYAEKILRAMPETLGGSMFLPIVTADADAKTVSVRAYTARLGKKGRAEIIPTDFYADDRKIAEPISTVDLFRPAAEAPQQKPVETPAIPAAPVRKPVPAIFQRNASILPFEVLSRRTVVVIGCGGARGFCESLARSAVGRFVLVDGDTVSESNIATQGTYLDEIGRYKTEVIAETLRRINPDVQITELRRFLDDSLTDSALEEAIGAEQLLHRPEEILLCGCTDSFAAQDRTVKLALKWGVPYLAAQLYAEGRGGEVLFTYPGLTAACPRCMLSTRYQAQENGTAEAVTSEGAPIYSTERVNALKSHLALSMLLHGTESRIGKELTQLCDRNLVLLSFTEDCEERLGLTAFSRNLPEAHRAAFPTEQTVWLRQKPDRPENGYPFCPYCGGTGDLRTVRGMIADTRQTFSLSALIAAVQPRTEPMPAAERMETHEIHGDS